MRHGPQELERFVEAIDAALPEPVSVLVIGGAAAALAYGATRPTDDIDTFHPLTPVVQKAVEAAQRSTGLTIPVSFAAVADAPYDFEDRLVPVRELRLERLTVVVPERHDLVLMKTLRGYQHDVEVIQQIHQRQPLVFEVLRSRWKREMSHAVADPRRTNLNFVEVVDRAIADWIEAFDQSSHWRVGCKPGSPSVQDGYRMMLLPSRSVFGVTS